MNPIDICIDEPGGAADVGVLACRYAEQAMRLARARRIDAAREALLDAERCGPFDSLTAAAISITIARAALLFFDEREDEAFQQIQAALERAQLARQPTLQARALSVLALMNLGRKQVIDAVRCAHGADALVDDADAETRYRTELAFGAAHSYAGDFAAAVDCYAWADAGAREAGDDLARAAITMAIAMAAVSDARQRNAAGTLDDDTRSAALLSLERAFGRIQPLVDPRSMRMQRVFVAELLCRGGDIAEARTELAELLPELMAQGPADFAALALAIDARCLLAEGNPAGSLAAARAALDRLDASDRTRGAGRLSDEIIATVHGDAATVLRAVHAPADAARHAELADRAWQRMLAGQRAVREQLAALHR